jgi:6-phosphofructokinase
LSKRTAIIVVNESASKVITTSFLSKLFHTESHGNYDVRTSILGHTQQGGKYVAACGAHPTTAIINHCTCCRW